MKKGMETKGIIEDLLLLNDHISKVNKNALKNWNVSFS